MPRGFQPPKGTPRQRPGAPRRSAMAEELQRTAKAGRGREAAELCERAVEKLARGDYRGAAQDAERVRDIAPRSAVAREVLGMALYGLERWGETLRELQTYRRMTGRADQNHLIADCHRALGAPQKAVPLAEEALATRQVPDEAKAEAAVVGASALADLGRHTEALALLRRLPANPSAGARPFDLRVWYVRGDILERAGRRDEARREFERIARHDPDAFDVAERLARLRPRRGRASGGTG